MIFSITPAALTILLVGIAGVVVLAMLVVRIAWHFLGRALAAHWPTPDPTAALAVGVARIGDLIDEALDTAPGRHTELMTMLSALGDSLIAVAQTPPVVMVEDWSDSGRTSTIRAANDPPAGDAQADESPTEVVPPPARPLPSDAYATQHGALPADPESPAEITGPRHAAPEPAVAAEDEVPTELVEAVAGHGG